MAAAVSLAVRIALVGLCCLLMPRYYQASTYLMPSESALSRPLFSPAQSTPDPGGIPRHGKPEEQFALLMRLVKANEVVLRAIKSRGLDMTPSDLAGLVQVEAAPGPQKVIRVTALARTRDGAISVANAIAHEFSGYHRDLVRNRARRDIGFLEHAVPAREKKLSAIREKLWRLSEAARQDRGPAGRAAQSSVRRDAKELEYERSLDHYQQPRQTLETARLAETGASTEDEVPVVDPARVATGPMLKGGLSYRQPVLFGLVFAVVLSLGTAVSAGLLEVRACGTELGAPTPTCVPDSALDVGDARTQTRDGGSAARAGRALVGIGAAAGLLFIIPLAIRYPQAASAVSLVLGSSLLLGLVIGAAVVRICGPGGPCLCSQEVSSEVQASASDLGPAEGA